MNNNNNSINIEKPYNVALLNNDKALAKELTSIVSNTRADLSIESGAVWGIICEKLGYPINLAFKDGDMVSHFRRVLVELQLLSVLGKCNWKPSWSF